MTRGRSPNGWTPADFTPNPLALGTYCDQCGCRIDIGKDATAPCPMCDPKETL